MDGTILGGAVGENIGFSGTDRRRFNVALSRAQDARIVICSQDFCKGEYVSTPWRALIEEHAKANAIIGDGMWMSALLPERLDFIFMSVVSDLSRRAGKPKVKTTLPASALVPMKGTEPPPKRCRTDVGAFISSLSCGEQSRSASAVVTIESSCLVGGKTRDRRGRVTVVGVWVLYSPANKVRSAHGLRPL